MTNHKIQFVGASCGQHGNYIFYKAFKYSLNGKQKVLSLGEFFLVKFWEEEDIISIGEPQLIWEDKTSGHLLVSLRIYFLPENTPEGRCEEHGEDEVVSLSEKVVLRADDVINIMRAASGLKWKTGLKGFYDASFSEGDSDKDSPFYIPPIAQSLDIQEVIKEKNLIGEEESNKVHVIVLTYDNYCRIRALMKRLEGVDIDVMKSAAVRALGGFVVPSKDTRLLFCRDIFDYPELEGHELLCNHLAPKLQGRPRKKRSMRTDSDSDSSETSEDQRLLPCKPKQTLLTKSTTVIPGLTAKPNVAPKVPKFSASHSSSKMSNALACQVKSEFSTPALDRLIEVDFMSKLYKFMKDRNTAITRLPYIGIKQLNVFELFTRVQQLGGYEVVSQKKLWKHLYEELSGKNCAQNSGEHNDAGGLKKHYERLLLPYENFLLQEQRRILGIGSKSSSMKSHKLLSNKQAKHSSSSQNNSRKIPFSPKSKCLEKNNYGVDNNLKVHSPLVKSEASEPSVSILQQSTISDSSNENVVGASFSVADGGSTTITLVPPNEHKLPGEPNVRTDSVNEWQQFAERMQFGLAATSIADGPMVHSLSTSNPFASSFNPDTMVPKLNERKDSSSQGDLSKRPEITITPIPRAFGSLLPGGENSLSSLQVADLMNMNLHSTLGVSALQDLAKIADRYDKATAGNLAELGARFAEYERPPPKKRRADGQQSSRVNGTNHNNTGEDNLLAHNVPRQLKSPEGRSSYQTVPNLISADLLRQMSAIESNTKLLLPAHQSTKTINALTALLPQTTIFPSPAPAAHQQSSRSARKPQMEASKPEPVFQSLSVYSQSKNIYGKPTAAHSSSETARRNNQDRRSSSPEIEILDLRVPGERRRTPTKSRKQLKSDVDIELLDLSTRRDITVSAIPKPGSSKSANHKIPPPQVSIVASDNAVGKSPAPARGAVPSAHGLPGDPFNTGSMGSLMAAFASQSIPSSLASLGVANPSVLQYLMSSGLKTPSAAGVSSMFPYMDPSSLASYYGLLSSGFLGPSNQPPTSSSSSSAVAAVAQQAAAAAQLVQLNSLGLAGLANVSPEAVASLGIYKNYLPQGSGIPPHFLSGLLSPGNNQGPPSSSK